MPLTTKFYNLVKPLLSEKFELKTWNKNMDMIDAALNSINERTNLSSPYIGTDVGNRTIDVIQIPINSKSLFNSIEECINETIVNSNKQNVEFIIEGTVDGLPVSSNYNYLVRTYGLLDGESIANPSKNILVKITEISEEFKTYISIFNIENNEFVSICDDGSSGSSKWEKIYPSRHYEDLKISSPNITLDATNVVDNSNSLEDLISSIILSTNSQFVQAVYEIRTDDEILEDDIPRYQLSISKFQNQENSSLYRVIRYKMSYPYTIDFNNFDSGTNSFSLDRWKLIYPADSMASLPDNVVTKEKDPVFLDNLGKTMRKYYKDIIAEADGSLESQIQNIINTDTNFHLVFLYESGKLSEVDVSYVNGTDGFRLFSVIETSKDDENYTVTLNYYSEEHSKLMSEIPIVLYPSPRPFITDEMKNELSSIYDPLHEKTIVIMGDDTCFGVDASDSARMIGYDKCLEDMHPYSEVVLNASYGVHFGNMNGEDTPPAVIDKIEELMNIDGVIDYVIIQVSYYDYFNQIPLGEITQGFDESEFDMDTYAGAMEECFYKILTSLSETRIGFIILSNLEDDDTKTIKLSEYYAIAEEICKKWRIPILDLRKTFDITNPIMASRFFDENGIELNKQGYKRIANIVDNFIKEL